MKKSHLIIIAVVVIVALVSLLGASLTAYAERSEAAEAPASSTVKTKVAHLSDIHIMIDEYCNIYSPAYQKAGNTSYKVLEQTTATAMTAFEEMYKKADGSYKAADDIPMYVVITGDLTSNGELANHLGVAQFLGEVTETIRGLKTMPGYEALAGFQIFVIPGNHDIDNQSSKCYTPALNDETWNALVSEGDPAKMKAYLSEYDARSVETTTMLEFMSIYSDFGYCNCPDKANGHHLPTCQIAEGVSLEFFYESDYWYEKGVTRSNTALDLGNKAVPLTKTHTYQYEYAVYDKSGNPSKALTEVKPTEAEISGFKTDKDIEYYARASRHGACSYIARVGDVTVLGIDANSHKWTDVKDNAKVGVVTSLGWQETTGGYMTEAQLNWMINALRADVAGRKLILTLAHENVLPHFDAEDEVISLFTYDNWEDVYTNLADNGIRYAFTGHQHTNDIESDVSQAGSVFYDVETGSTTCMGAGWRELDFEQTTYADGAYAEDVYSTMHFLHYNTKVGDVDAFGYERFEVTGATAPDGKYERVTVYQGKNGLDTSMGEYQDMADYMSQALKKMIENIAGNFVNDKLMDTLGNLVDKMANSSMSDFYPLASKAVTDLGNLNLYRFVDNHDGTFTLSTTPDPAYHLTDFAIDLTDYFLHYDYSFDKKLGVYLDDVLLQVYGAHLIGAQYTPDDVIPENIRSLLDSLTSGKFLRFVEDLLYRGVLPEVELILDAPIYWGDSINYLHKTTTSAVTPDMVKDGKGFDLSTEAKALFESDNLIASIAKTIIEPSGKKNGLPGIDVSSLKRTVMSVPNTLDPAIAAIADAGIDVYALLSELLGSNLDSIIDKAIGYIKMITEDGTLADIIKTELLDKYVTDAFCKNLGSYGAYVVGTVVVDDSFDGVKRTTSDGWFPYEVEERFHIELTYAGDKSAMQGHTYYCDKDGKDTVKVVATKENGLLPSKITLGNVIDAEGNLDVTKKEIRFFTQRDVDYSDAAATCKQYEWNETDAARATQFYCELEYADNAAFTSSTLKQYKGDNVWIEYPTVDLGIIYLNLTYAYRQYNVFDVVLEGLEAGKTYYYRLRSVDVDGTGKTVATYDWTDPYSFTTPAKDGGVSIMAMTDIQGSIEANYVASQPNMLKAVGAGNPAFIVSCGDNVDTGKNIAQWGWLLDDQAAVWANYTFSGVVGNHEKHDYALSSITATPAVATVEESGFYYSYNYQDVHFVMLNTNDVAADGTLGEAQYKWLEADLDKASKDAKVQFIVVVLHKGPYTAGSHAFDDDVIAMRAQLSPLFAAKQVDLVLQGHDHTYSVSEYIGGTADANGKYTKVDVKYDATGAAIDPDGVLYVNLGTMGDKYYNYIYSSLVTLRDRSGDNYLDVALSDYMTAEGNLELSPVRNSKTVLPETPVYAYLNVKDGRLALTTYTVINGTSYVVDDIAITKNPKNAGSIIAGEDGKAKRDVTVLGVRVSTAALDTLETVRVSITTPQGVEFYVGYRLADVMAKANKDKTSFYYNGEKYEVSDCYLVIAKANAAGEVGEAIEPTVMICGQGSALFVPASDLNGLPAWAIAVIVIAAVLVAGLILVFILLVAKRRKASAPVLPEVVEDESIPSDEAETSIAAEEEAAPSPDDTGDAE